MEIINQLSLWLKKHHLPQSYLANIIEKVYGVSSDELIINPESYDINELNDFCKHYEQTGLPIAYLCGFEYFYNHKFIVNQNTLIPRVETEELVLMVIDYIKSTYQIGSKISILDLCCGSGCIGISLYLALQKEYTINLTLADISLDALDVCKRNTQYHQVECQIIESDLLTNIDQVFDIITINPPYVPSTRKLDDLVNKEPSLALYSGVDGMDCYRRFFEQLHQKNIQAKIFGECDPTQEHALCSLDDDIIMRKDLSGVVRFVER